MGRVLWCVSRHDFVVFSALDCPAGSVFFFFCVPSALLLLLLYMVKSPKCTQMNQPLENPVSVTRLLLINRRRCCRSTDRSTLRRRVFEDLLNWMIMARQPLQAPEHPLLRKALQTATGSPSFNCGGQKEFREALLSKRDQATTVLKEMLKGATPAVTADIWTSDTNVSTGNKQYRAPYTRVTYVTEDHSE